MGPLQVTRSFAEDFCVLWKEDLGKFLIPQLLDMALNLTLAAGVP